MAKADLAALLALAAAFFMAVGDVIHQRSARGVTDEPIGHLELFGRLLRDGRWWVGSGTAAAGFVLQAAALGLGSVLLVQALLVTSLLFALPISARLSHRRVTRWELLWAAVLAGAVAVIVTVGNPTEGASRASLETWLGVATVLGPLLALCVVGATVWSGPISAVLTKAVVHRLDVTSLAGVTELLRTPELYAWAVVGLLGTSTQQAAFRAGALTASLPTMTVAEPVVASVLSVVVLGETLRPGAAGWATLVVAVAAMVTATAALARGEATVKEPSG